LPAGAAAEVADPAAVLLERDGLDLGLRPGAAASGPLPGAVEPVPVRVERRHQVGHALAARGHGAHHGPAPRGLGALLPEREHLPQIADGLRGAVAVGLVHREHVGDLEDARLGGLHAVTHSRGEEHNGGVGEGHHLHLGLAHAHGLDEHHVAAGRVEHPHGLRRGPGQPTEVPPGGHRPDEHAVVRGVLPHPHPVSEQCAAGERRGGIDGEHPHLPPLLPQEADHRRGGGRLPDAGWPGQAHDVRTSGVRAEGGRHLAQCGVGTVLDERDQPCDGQLLAAPGALDQLRDVGPAPQGPLSSPRAPG
jgi:hypothetical protein